MPKSLFIFLARLALTSAVLAMMVFGILSIPQTIDADLKNSNDALNPVTMIQDGRLTICTLNKSSYEVVETVSMVITAYTSTPSQTKSYGSPFITASGKPVADGVIANNGLAFGTEVMIPQLYGDKIFTVEDRMNSKMGDYHVDIWFPGAYAGIPQALKFGKKEAQVEVIAQS